ncbi:MAG: hypothetical protein J6A58_07655 [Oscillospiraceae bacterium]|nr:hypothetical protein [Oscillospiraceae bacterium]
MKKYMILNNKYSVEYGKYDATLFNFEDYNFFSINGERFKLFKDWIKGEPIDTDEFNETSKEFYEFLKNNDVAQFSDKFYISEQFNVGKKLSLYNEKICKLSRLFISLGDDEVKKTKNITSPCWVCLSDSPVKIQNPELYVELIKKIASDGGDQIILYGGNVIANPEISTFMKVADESYIQLCINVNSKTLIDEEIKLAEEYNTILVVTFDFSEKFDMDHFNNVFERIKQYGVLAKYSFVVSNDTIEKYKMMEDKISDLGAEIVNLSIVMDDNITENELSEVCIPKNIGFEEYKIYKSMNPCMAGSLVVDTDMSILPCPVMKKHQLGKVVYANGEIKMQMNRDKYRLSDFWLSSKEYINNCSECSRKHLCMDCRGAELSVGDINNNFFKRECEYMNKCRDYFEMSK